jgi:hypothetical protein
MNRIVVLMIVVAFILSGCLSRQSSKPIEEPVKPRPQSLILFDDGTEQDFGKDIPMLTKITHPFVYRNASDSVPLVIDSVKASCGCTAVTYPHYPVMPGETDTIFITFDSAGGGKGYFRKTIQIYSNSPYVIELKVTGTYLDSDLDQ